MSMPCILEFDVPESWFATAWDDEPAKPVTRRRHYTQPAPQPVTNHTDASAWSSRRLALADAAMHLANRTDATGGYRANVTTRKDTDWDWLPLQSALFAHFGGRRTIGLHSTSPANTCRWVAFDIDAHDGESEANNLDTALSIAARLRQHGLTPYLFDSDGRGGIHVWAVLHAVTPSADAFALARQVADGLDVEAFPKQARIERYGNWLRLPGRHHHRNHWSRVWLGERWGTADETVEAVLAMAGRASFFHPS